MSSVEYKKRYNDVYTFTKTEDGNVLWEGSFRWSRLAWANDYSKAYEQYLKDEPNPIPFEDFCKEVHHYDADTLEPGKLAKLYARLVVSDINKIHMVDPSGGPYIEEGAHLGRFLGEEFQNMIVDQFESIEGGYKIIIKKNGPTSNTSSKEI